MKRIIFLFALLFVTQWVTFAQTSEPRLQGYMAPDGTVVSLSSFAGQSPTTLIAKYLQMYASAPTCSRKGQMYYDTVLNKQRVCTATPSTWETVASGAGVGTVTSVSVVTANGQSGSVATATTTPAITLNNPTALVATTSVQSPFFVTNASDPADGSAFRLGNNEFIAWEKFSPGTDWTLGVNASDVLVSSAPFSIGAGSAITSSGAGGALGAIAFVVPGTGVATALAVNVGSAGAFVTFNGAGGTPSSLTGTNISGTAASLTAGAVTGFTAGAGVLTGPASAGVAVTLGNNETITGVKIFSPTARSSGSASYLTVNTPADTGLATATESIGVTFAAGTRTFVDGTVALQRERVFSGPTYNKTTTSATFTDVFNTFWTPPIAGTGVTFTRNHTLGVQDSTSAASSITGAMVIANTIGTTATSVGIGGGNINAGGTGTFGGTLSVTGHTTFEGVTSTGATGTGNLVYSASPTLSGTVGGALTFSSSQIISGQILNLSTAASFGFGASFQGFQVGGNFALQSQNTQAASNFTVLAHNTYYDGTNHKYISTDAASKIVLSSTIDFATVASGTAGNTATYTSRLTVSNTGAISLPSIASSTAAQTGTMCWTTGGNVTYDPSVGCLASLEDLKIKHGSITNALGTVMKLSPFWFTWKPSTPQYVGDKHEQAGLGAHQVESVDKRLVGYSPEGQLTGVRYSEMAAVLVKAIQELNEKTVAQEKEIEKLKDERNESTRNSGFRNRNDSQRTRRSRRTR